MDNRTIRIRFGLTGILLSLFVAGCASTTALVSKSKPLCPTGTVLASVDEKSVPTRYCRTENFSEARRPAPPQRVERARQEFAESDQDVPEVFVGLSISGGGSRAAIFGMAVLRELDRLGILRHISAISTTSGGGLPGAYYALNADAMDWDKAETLMSADYLGAWARHNLSPSSVGRILTTAEDRSDLMASVFDEALFGGKRYSDLGPFVPGRAPIWLANATEIGESRRFTFTDREFDRINAQLASYPVAYAVVASAAFPGVFNSVTLTNYGAELRRGEKLLQPAKNRYKHLIDGGPSDNLGIEALLKLAASHQAYRVGKPKRGNDRQGTCMMLVVDAYARGVPSRYDDRPDLRGAIGRLVDLNFFDAVDVMLATRRADLLSYLALEDGGQYGARVPQFVYFDSPRIGARIGQSRGVSLSTLNPSAHDEEYPAELAAAQSPPPHHFRCAAWHINLGGLITLRSSDVPGSPDLLTKEVEDQRKLHQYMVSQIDTNFRLKGPRGCTPSTVAQALREAATVLVREDARSRKAACRWLRSNGLEVDSSCDASVGVSSLERMPLRNRVILTSPDAAEGIEIEEVQCGSLP